MIKPKIKRGGGRFICERALFIWYRRYCSVACRPNPRLMSKYLRSFHFTPSFVISHISHGSLSLNKALRPHLSRSGKTKGTITDGWHLSYLDNYWGREIYLTIPLQSWVLTNLPKWKCRLDDAATDALLHSPSSQILNLFLPLQSVCRSLHCWSTSHSVLVFNQSGLVSSSQLQFRTIHILQHLIWFSFFVYWFSTAPHCQFFLLIFRDYFRIIEKNYFCVSRNFCLRSWALSESKVWLLEVLVDYFSLLAPLLQTIGSFSSSDFFLFEIV